MADAVPHDTEPRTARQAFEQMMRQQVAPGLRQLGFAGTFLTFRYRRGHRLALLWVSRSRHNSRELTEFRLLMTGEPLAALPGELELRSLMVGQPVGFGWAVVAGQPTWPVAQDVIAAVRRYGVPAMESMLTDADRPAEGWRRTFPQENDAPGEGQPSRGADPEAWYARPTGTSPDAWFASLADGDARGRIGAVLLLENALGDPRTVPALIDRLAKDPEPLIRRLVVTRVLARLTSDPLVTTALSEAASMDERPEVRWAARYALALHASDRQEPTTARSG